MVRGAPAAADTAAADGRRCSSATFTSAASAAGASCSPCASRAEEDFFEVVPVHRCRRKKRNERHHSNIQE